MDRNGALKFVYRRLTDPDLRGRMNARNSDGETVVLIAMRDDTVRTMLADVKTAGGSANVVVPYLNGLCIMTVVDEACADGHAGDLLTLDCTVGVLLERLRADGDRGRYCFVTELSSACAGQQSAAELVAIAG